MSTIEPGTSVDPINHSYEEALAAIGTGDLQHNVVLEKIAYHAQQSEWESLWCLADALKREVSVLFDSQGLIWVDVGTRGQVRLSPPIGCRLPLKLWIHTHPWDAYWSHTDRNTLSSASRVLEEAIVLGHDHYVLSQNHYHGRTRRRGAGRHHLSAFGPLSTWTDEHRVMYTSLNDPMEGF